MLQKAPSFTKIKGWRRGKLSHTIENARAEFGNKASLKTVIEWLFNDEKSNILDLTCRELWHEYVKDSAPDSLRFH